VQDRLDLAGSQRIFSNDAAQLTLVHVVHIARTVQVSELLGISKIIYYENVSYTLGIQLVNQVATYKSRTTCND